MCHKLFMAGVVISLHLIGQFYENHTHYFYKNG